MFNSSVMSTNYTTYVCYFLDESKKMSNENPWWDDPDCNLNIHDWYDNLVEQRLEHNPNRNANPARNNERNLLEETASLLTRATMQGMPMDQDFTDNAEMANAISMCGHACTKTCKIVQFFVFNFSTSLTK